MSAIFANIRMILGLVRPTSMTWYLDTPSKDPHTPSLVVRISNFCNQHRNLCLTGICTGPWNFWQCPEWPALGGMLYTLETCAALCSLRVTMGRFQYAPLTLLFGAWIPQFRIRRYIMETNQTNHAQRKFQAGRDLFFYCGVLYLLFRAG